MRYPFYILGLAAALLFCLVVGPQWTDSRLTAAEIIMELPQDPAQFPPADIESKSVEAQPSQEKKVAEADLSMEPTDLSLMKDESHPTVDVYPGYRPLCGPSKYAINHVYCAPGYDVY